QKIFRLIYEIRRWHYGQTLPWGDGGQRLLPGDLYLEYSKKISNYRRKFMTRVENFLRIYPELMRDAAKTLNGLFKNDDYPDLRDLRNKFAFEVRFSPISEADDLRVKLQDDEVEKLKRQIESRQSSLQEEAMRDLWGRVYEVVKPLADKLNDPKGIFRDSLVEKVHDLTNLLPRLNIAGDKALNDMTNEIRAKLCKHSPAELRDLEGVRGKVAKEADEILDRMKGYVGGSR
ncbi:MAG: hypothetical protein APR56_00445, partial [Methanosaeta sp. SDB]